jgi:cation-transporting ATPase 13A1
MNFMFQRLKFIYRENKKCFSKLEYPSSLPLGDYNKATGLCEAQAEKAKAYFGGNRFEMPMPTFIELFKEHAVAPFFVFQVFCVGLWCLDEFWYYSVFTLVMLVMFESTVVGQRLKNMTEFRAMSLPNADVKVRRSGKWVSQKTEELLPGDLVLLEGTDGEEITVPCDLVLIDGTCIVNEAMISGESTPMLKESIKEAIQEEEFERPLDSDLDRSHLLFGGTKILQITKNTENGCVAFVMRTGFSTLQGKLVRTMMFTSERMTANNLEAFAFILFLLIFAMAAAGYVLYYAWNDPTRSKFKLLLEGTLIITAVVPPELPMELSLAVNNSLIALSKYAIFCMEPFRIPLAGKLDVCCFDKTGTLTGENLVVKGVAGISDDHEAVLSDIENIPTNTHMVIGTCHSLFKVGDKVVGDPMEKTALSFVKWTMTSNDTLQNGKRSARILHRFPFSSALKRMSCLVSTGSSIMITCKGAPEVVEEMLVNIPPWYREAFTHLAHSGARVLALAHKTLPSTFSNEQAKHYQREKAESGLTFAGFLIFHCPLKPDSKEAVRALKESLHHVVMITGDNVLTAVHTAFELGMVHKPVLLLQEGETVVEAGNAIEIEIGMGMGIGVDIFDQHNPKAIPPKISLTTGMYLSEYDLAMTGEAVDIMAKSNPNLLRELISRVTVFARASPSQKELILTTYKTLGYTTLMCGDGTNDVGALKQSHVGVALLDGKPEDLPKILKQMQTVNLKKRQIAMEKSRLAMEQQWAGNIDGAGNLDARRKQFEMQKRIEAMTMSLEEDEAPMVRLGDASVAAPFTSKISTISAVCNLVRQGRCTLVTTMQMYKILALNSLISAYGLSVLHLEGIRYGDFQVTVTGMLLASCFLFLSKAQPIEKLAAKRPQPNIFNWYVLMSVLLQFLLHVSVLYYVVSAASRWSFKIWVDENTRFVPGLVNTTVYLISLLMQVSTFVVNYQVL